MKENLMKIRGEEKVWKDVKKKGKSDRLIASTQIGQQMILDETFLIEGEVRNWIDKKCAKTYRKDFQEFFHSAEILQQKIAEVLLLLAGTIYLDPVNTSTKPVVKTRHRQVNTIRSKILQDLSFDNVWRFMEVVVNASKFFNVESDLHRNNDRYMRSIRYTTTLSEEICSKLILRACDAFYPLPITDKPLDWIKVGDGDDTTVKGGYRTFQYDMIRSGSSNISYSKQSQKIFDAVNYIQSIPWRVNEALLNRVKLDLKHPVKADYVKAVYPDLEPARFDIDLTQEHLGMTEAEKESLVATRNVIKEQIQLYNAEVGDYDSEVGKYRAVKLAVEVAEQFIDKDIYFPHSYDFRGRVYPLPVGLSPQGSDAVKAMLEYSRGEVVNNYGAKWMWAYLASLYGDDKIDFENRVLRGKELIDADYKEADEPYQFYAHQLDIKKWLANPEMEVKARIHLDACNSGSQFTSAITGDLAGCVATNVYPTYDDNGEQIRKDAYLLVANKAYELAEELSTTSQSREDRNTYRFFSELLRTKGRKICKVPVMVSNYGGTTGGRTDILWNMLREMKVERKWINRKVASKFSRVIGESITGVLSGGKAFETYIQQMNNVIAKDNKPVYWDTSDGFHVIHVKNKELRAKQIQCTLPGARKITTISQKVFSDKVNPTKMKSAIAPNYIHSLDAELLRRVALRLKSIGIDNSDWIHDSFGCHPNYVDKMLEITKDEFKKLARREPLKILDAQFRKQASDRKSTETQLNRIEIPKLRGFNAREGGLDIVMESDWFFS